MPFLQRLLAAVMILMAGFFLFTLSLVGLAVISVAVAVLLLMRSFRRRRFSKTIRREKMDIEPGTVVIDAEYEVIEEKRGE